MEYLPEASKDGSVEHIDREYFFGVLGTVKEQETRTLIRNALDQRYSAKEGEEH